MPPRNSVGLFELFVLLAVKNLQIRCESTNYNNVANLLSSVTFREISPMATSTTLKRLVEKDFPKQSIRILPEQNALKVTEYKINNNSKIEILKIMRAFKLLRVKDMSVKDIVTDKNNVIDNNVIDNNVIDNNVQI